MFQLRYAGVLRYGSDILKHKPYTATTLDEKKDQTEFCPHCAE